MKLFYLASLALAAVATPLVDLEETTLTLDQSKATLDQGQIALHLTRIDDLLDDHNDMKLVLERVTHIGISVQLDVATSSITVNGHSMPLLLPPGQGVAVAIAKAEAYSMPPHLPAALYEPEAVQSLTQSMSKGIASISIRIDSEEVPVDAIGSVVGDHALAIMPVKGVSLRKLGLFVTVNEIEGTSFEHSRTVFTPIVQLLVSSESVDGQDTVKQISTLSVGGRPVLPEAVHSNDFLPDVAGMLPPLEETVDKVKEQVHHQWTGLKHEASGLWAALESIFGQPRYEAPELSKRPPVDVAHPGRFGQGRKGLALGPGAPQFANNGNRPHHKHHAKGHCFWKNMATGFSMLGSGIASLVTDSIYGFLLFAFFTGGILFHLIRRIKRRKALCEALPQYEGDMQEELLDEKPPTYQSDPLPTTVIIFEADDPAHH